MTQKKTNGRNKNSRNGQAPGTKSPTDARSDKRAQFEGGGKRSPLVWIVPIAVLAVVALAAVVAMNRGGADKPVATAAAATATQPTAAGDKLSIPVADISDGQVHFYETDVNGTTVKYLAVKGADGTIRTSLDACQVCFQAKKGYSQSGDAVICGNCGRSFAIDQIGVQHGGCNPISIKSTTKGDQLLIDAAGINDGVQFFQ